MRFMVRTITAIGKWTTLGCIRMYNNDIHWLFERIPQQATVTVK